jgi:hypothetical protein
MRDECHLNGATLNAMFPLRDGGRRPRDRGFDDARNRAERDRENEIQVHSGAVRYQETEEFRGTYFAIASRRSRVTNV